MPFIPHSKNDEQEMLDYLKQNTDDLFNEIPAELINNANNWNDNLAKQQVHYNALNECEISRLMQQREPSINPNKSFLGAGAYSHFIPAAVWDITSRGEWLTAYTPYQAEASQGSLELTYKFQSLMCELMQLDVCNASVYDGASALAESILMAVRIKRNKACSVLIPNSIHPHYKETIKTLLPDNIKLINIPFDLSSGVSDLDYLNKIPELYNMQDMAALVIPQPNFFGKLEPVDQLTNWAKKHNMLSIAVVNPTMMSILNPPGLWGETLADQANQANQANLKQIGVDIACGEGQPLGIPLSYGGPYFGFMLCKQKYVREIPGRLVGKTIDTHNKTGYTLTLQSREQHIRRAKAKSNICTNQGLCVTAATIYMSIVGAAGLADVAKKTQQQTQYLYKLLLEIPGINPVFISNNIINECVVKFDPNYIKNPTKVMLMLEEQGFQAGFCLGKKFAQLNKCYLLCATETKTNLDIECFINQLQQNINKSNLKQATNTCTQELENIN